MQQMKSVYGLNKFKGAQNQYVEQSILTASPADLVTMLYEAAIKNVKFSKNAIDDKNYELSNTHLKKSQEIIDELIKGLDMSFDMSNDMLLIYEFILNQLVESNISKNGKNLEDVESILTQLHQTWKEAVVLSRTQKISV